MFYHPKITVQISQYIAIYLAGYTLLISHENICNASLNCITAGMILLPEAYLVAL